MPEAETEMEKVMNATTKGVVEKYVLSSECHVIIGFEVKSAFSPL